MFFFVVVLLPYSSAGFPPELSSPLLQQGIYISLNGGKSGSGHESLCSSGDRGCRDGIGILDLGVSSETWRQGNLGACSINLKFIGVCGTDFKKGNDSVF